MMVDWSLELHGSEVHWTRWLEGELRLRFSAAVVRQGVGRAMEEGHVKGLELCFPEATWVSGDAALCLGALGACSLSLHGMPHQHITLPLQFEGEVQAEFTFRSGTTLVLSARGAKCLPPLDARFQTSYAC